VDVAMLQQIAAVEPPAGCTAAFRTEGIDAGQNFAAALALCAVDPDVITLTIFAETLGDEPGYLGSDAPVQLTLASGAE
jgi:hypothetical protein